MARLPSCFAASQRIFKELAVRFPGFEPKTLLDFGAGPGTAIWAAQEVRDCLRRVASQLQQQRTCISCRAVDNSRHPLLVCSREVVGG